MYAKRLSQILVVLLAVTNLVAAQQPAKRPLKLDDLARVREVRDPQVSPDGQWVAYVVSTIDVKEDKSAAHIWMVSFDGKNDRQITWSQESENSPRWSPDGKYLAFTSSRPGKAKGNQVWLLDRSGGERARADSFGRRKCLRLLEALGAGAGRRGRRLRDQRGHPVTAGTRTSCENLYRFASSPHERRHGPRSIACCTATAARRP